jgi:hypothetical protein
MEMEREVAATETETGTGTADAPEIESAMETAEREATAIETAGAPRIAPSLPRQW